MKADQKSSTHKSFKQLFDHCLATAREYKINLLAGRTSFFTACNRPTLHKSTIIASQIECIEQLLEQYSKPTYTNETTKNMLAEYFRQLAGAINIKRRKFKDGSDRSQATLIWRVMQHITPTNQLDLQYYTNIQQITYNYNCKNKNKRKSKTNYSSNHGSHYTHPNNLVRQPHMTGQSYFEQNLQKSYLQKS